MPCPFGYTADDGDEAEDEVSEAGDEGEAAEDQDGEIADGEGVKEEGKTNMDAPTKEDGKKSKKGKAAVEDKDRFDIDKDPISWFYQNQIKSEEDFAKKKDVLRDAAKKRLDDIMGKKGKGIEWPSDSEFDDLSIHSSELSDLDSDCDSLASLASVANSWIVEARYKTPAESWLKTVAWIYMVVLVHSLFTALVASVHMRKVQGIAVNTSWGSATFIAVASTMALTILLLVAAHYRSRRMLLGAQLGFLAAYAASVVLITLNWFLPAAVDAKLKEGACSRYSSNDRGSKLCKMLPSVEKEIAEDTGNLLFGLSVLTGGSILLVGLGIWYIMELGYVEKKAFKHKRRHKRRKHRIPWDKIKIVGPVTQCGGAASSKPANSKAAGKCPVGFGGSAPSGGACPMSGAGAAVAATGSKKEN